MTVLIIIAKAFAGCVVGAVFCLGAYFMCVLAIAGVRRVYRSIFNKALGRDMADLFNHEREQK